MKKQKIQQVKLITDLGIDNSPLTTEEYPQEFSTAFDIDRENKDLWRRMGIRLN